MIERMYFSLSMAISEALGKDEHSKIIDRAMAIYNSFYRNTEDDKLVNPLEGTIWENK